MSPKKTLILIIPVLFLILLNINLYIETKQHFVLLAKSFLNGEVTIVPENNNDSDHVYFNGRYYWPLGPLPAVLLIPFVILDKNFLQGYVSFILTVINFYILYKIALKLKLDKEKSLLISTFFIFGSVYTPLALIPASWYFAQVVACSFTIYAIFEFLNKKRYFLIGLLIAASIMTRFNLIISSIFFFYFLFKKPFSLSNLVKFITPIIFSIILIGAYNYVRFKNPLENGYNLQIIAEAAANRREIGLFSISHIPSNLFYMLLKGPEPILNSAHELKSPYITFDSYGLSLFFLSPVLFLLYKTNFKKELTKISTITAIIMLFPLLTYYGIGHNQVGYRYALDLFPFVFLIIIDSFHKTKPRYLYPLILFGIFFCFFFSILYRGGLKVN